MTVTTVPSAVSLGATGEVIHVQASVAIGLPSFTILGRADGSSREVAHRAAASCTNTGISWPSHTRRVTVASPEAPYFGSSVDLAITVAVLHADGKIAGEVERTAFVAELGLDGALRPTAGIVPMAAALAERDYIDRVIVPADSSAVVANLGHKITPVGTLRETLGILNGGAPPPTTTGMHDSTAGTCPDMADLRRANPAARRALEIAAAGGHHLLLIGPTGSGKSAFARRLPGLLPDLTPGESTETTAAWSAAGLHAPGPITRPPFRAPHHSTSMVGFVGGGGSALRPGELGVAHNGVLYLDDLPEFPPATLDALRATLDDQEVRVARGHRAVTMPARFHLVASMLPCPCGNNDPCRCSDNAKARYARRVSGPLLDRFDLRVRLDRPTPAEFLGSPAGDSTATIAARVAAARARANEPVQLTGTAEELIADALGAGLLSARGATRVVAVARTIADLDGHDGPPTGEHIDEALFFRAPIGIGKVAC